MHTITVLHVPGCAGGKASLAIAVSVAESHSEVAVNGVVVDAEEEAISLGFRGSPTILVDGHDLESDSQTPLGSMG